MFFSIIVAVLCFSSGAFAGSGPQRFTDVIFMILKENDPLFVEKIDGNLSILKYTLYNTTIDGHKNCEVKNVKINEDETASQLELYCSPLTLVGDYDINGRLIVLNVEGHGGYTIVTGKYKVTIKFNLSKTQGKDGKTHLEVKNYEIKCEGLSPNKYDFKNLFNGQKELSDAVHKFANENWKEVGPFLEVPAWTAVVGNVISKMNKYFKDVPSENIVLS